MVSDSKHNDGRVVLLLNGKPVRWVTRIVVVPQEFVSGRAEVDAAPEVEPLNTDGDPLFAAWPAEA